MAYDEHHINYLWGILSDINYNVDALDQRHLLYNLHERVLALEPRIDNASREKLESVQKYICLSRHPTYLAYCGLETGHSGHHTSLHSSDGKIEWD